MKFIWLCLILIVSTSFSQISLLIIKDDSIYGNGSLGNVSINTPTNLNNNGTDYQYDNLTINAGGKINIVNDGNNTSEEIIIIRVKNTLTINGTIEGISGTYAQGSFYKSIPNTNIKIGKTNQQQSGGSGRNGQSIAWTSEVGNVSASSPNHGNGGGGGGSNGNLNGCSGPDKALKGNDATFDRGGNGGQGGEGGTGASGGYIYSSSGGNAGYNGCGGGGGGGGGARGLHGNLILIIAKNITGNGSVILKGSNGGNGGNGAAGGNGGTGGGGGGGAGGNGGTIWMLSKNNTFNGSFNLSGGSGGSGGSGYDGLASSGSNGLLGSIIYIDLHSK